MSFWKFCSFFFVKYESISKNSKVKKILMSLLNYFKDSLMMRMEVIKLMRI